MARIPLQKRETLLGGSGRALYALRVASRVVLPFFMMPATPPSSSSLPALLGGEPAVPAGAHRRWPTLTAADHEAVRGVLERGVLSGPFAPEALELQEAFAEFVGVRHCLLTHSGTSALHMALAAAGVEPGDEVIVPAFTFIATALAVLHHGAIPVFADIDAQTFTLDPASAEQAISERTRALMPVHIHGVPADMDALNRLAASHNLVLIEDACQAHGATWRGKMAGSLGLAAGFSLQASKNLPAGEGGLFVTDDDELAHRANRLRNFGEDAKPSDFAYDPARPLDATRAYDAVALGYMYRGQETVAALARSRLERLAADTAHAQRLAERLAAGFAELPGMELQRVPDGASSCWHKVRVVLDAESAGVAEQLAGHAGASPGATQSADATLRDLVMRALHAEGVEAVQWQTKPVPAQGLFQNREGYGRGYPWSLATPEALARYAENYQPRRYPRTQQLLERSFCLFSHSHPLIAQDEHVVDAYIGALKKVSQHLPTLLEQTKPAGLSPV